MALFEPGWAKEVADFAVDTQFYNGKGYQKLHRCELVADSAEKSIKALPSLMAMANMVAGMTDIDKLSPDEKAKYERAKNVGFTVLDAIVDSLDENIS